MIIVCIDIYNIRLHICTCINGWKGLNAAHAHFKLNGYDYHHVGVHHVGVHLTILCSIWNRMTRRVKLSITIQGE